MSPRRRFRKVGIVAKAGSREAAFVAHELAEWLRRRGLEAELDEATLRARGGAASSTPAERAFRPGDSCDLVVVLGGDGTLLAAARAVGSDAPIFGVNLGTLGFLTEVGRGDLYPSLVQVLAGRFKLEERSLFDVELLRNGSGSLRYQVFNDAVVTKSALARIIELTLRIDGQLIARFRADGLIISTPTGSTAYNLSAGGPILSPLLPVAVLTPICPHALSLRPIVVPDAGPIEVTLETQREEVYLTLDGQEGTSVGFRDVVRIGRSRSRVRLVKVSGRGFYDSLRGKLRWGGFEGSGPGGHGGEAE